MPPADPHRLNLVFAAAEAVPYAKTGGLADVVGALPLELAKLGHRVSLILPGYPDTLRIPARRQIAKFSLTVGGARQTGLIEQVKDPADAGGVRVLTIRCDPYFNRPNLYQENGLDYPDNLERFAFFSQGVLQALEHVQAEGMGKVDVLHLHDWQVALCSVYLKHDGHPSLDNLKTLLTIHNIGYQGLFPAAQFDATGLPRSLFAPSALEFYGSMNLLKGGILFSDAVSTVSPTYAKEILTKEFGCGLEGVLGSRPDKIRGIANGIDVTIWNPETDGYLPATYSLADLSGKRICKKALQREMQLPDRDVPLAAAIGRLTSQKGFDLLLEILPELMRLDLQLIILGAGDPVLEEQLQAARKKYRDKLSVHVGFDEGLAHRMEGGADMMIMPSRYEPCGLTQLYSLRYGTVPIVRKTGGLADTVVPYKPSTAASKQATGFHVVDASGDSLLSTMLLALEIFKDRDRWHGLMQTGMQTDVSWTHAAKEYVSLYKEMGRGAGSGKPATAS